MRRLNFVWAGFSVLLLAVIFSGCLKSIDQQPVEKKAYISLMHLAPKAPALEVYVNGTKSSSGIVPGAYSSAYSAVSPGTFDITFKKASSDSVVAELAPALYDSLKYYTLMVYNDQPTSAKALRIVDDFSGFASSPSLYRFFHVSADVPAVDFYINNTKVQSDRQFADNAILGSYNAFTGYSTGTYSLQVKKAGTDSLIVQTDAVFVQGGAYTVFLNGQAPGGAVNSLKLSVLQASNF